jgi:hypothetical protein
MKNFNSFQTLSTLTNVSMSSIKGGATMDEINSVYQHGFISSDQYKNILDQIQNGQLDLNTLTGEWWGGGVL